jgi:hypothetical protein
MLVYGKGRKNIQHIPQTKAIRKKMRADMRAYFTAEMVNGLWVIGDRVADEDW